MLASLVITLGWNKDASPTNEDSVDSFCRLGTSLRAQRNCLFPKRLILKTPGSTELLDRFDEARDWSAKLRAMKHVRIEMREVRHRVLGANALPAEAWVDSVDDAVALIGKQKEAAAFRRVVEVVSSRQPLLLPWLEKKPLRALELADDGSRLLDVVGWLQAHPRPGIYLRQMDVPGVHSKFVEDHRAVLSEWLDLALPAAAVDEACSGAKQFARRYGFRDKPERIRFRMLDPAHNLLPGEHPQDFTLDSDSFVRLETSVSLVFITENEINFLAFPAMRDSMVLFGAGYGFEALGRAEWLTGCAVWYWGDIDTHGFSILDQLRGHFPHVRSLLMDRATLLAHRDLWGREDKPRQRDLAHLLPEEQAVYDDLRDNRLGDGLRLEQERIGFDWVLAALGELGAGMLAG
jgi:hypothetical protein